jgi:molecular chaperone GrpE
MSKSKQDAAADAVEQCGEDRLEEAAETETAADPVAQLEALEAERDQLAAEKADLHDRLLRRQADFENLRRRSEREKEEIREFAAAASMGNLLPILDDFERALSHECADQEYAKGMDLIYQRLIDTLQKLGLEPIPAEGQKFDPHIHHAVETVQTDEVEDHTILAELQRGYNFRGRLLRPSMVKVAVAPSPEGNQ